MIVTDPVWREDADEKNIVESREQKVIHSERRRHSLVHPLGATTLQ